MEGTRQRTLFETWGQSSSKGAGTSSAFAENLQIYGRGGRFSKPSNVRGRGRGSKRGAGRGRGKIRDNDEHPNVGFEDDDDNICELALSHFELTTNDVSNAFKDINNATDLPGFDKAAGDIWIYPTNKVVRDYQFNIVQTALYNNTLVTLPTGLGKTFIAAVVMYNFHRWYPKNLIIFMAPTRPLVTQQLDACHELMGIAPDKMMELTGQITPAKREAIWKDKTVFFLTPQVFVSDLTRGYCPAEEVRCIVVDEAHKAQGNHAFVQAVTMLTQKNKHFRVLALSATPGTDIAAVQEVFKNLTISKVELRGENSPDILPYTHQKQVEKIVVPLDYALTSVFDLVIEIFQHYTGKLMKQNILFGRDGSSFTQFQLLRARELFRSNPPSSIRNWERGKAEVDFATCITLAHAIELLIIHGLRSFYSFLSGVLNKEKGTPAVAAELRKNSNAEEILSNVQTKLNISVENSRFDVSSLGLLTSFSKDTTLPGSNEDADYLSSHPKMRVLKDIVAKHFQSFQSTGKSTRVMIFSQYRDSVQDIGNMLNSLRPLVKPMVFFGQAKTGLSGRGLRQKDQIHVLQSFRDGQYNVLVSTCVGEEGLDIGDVDLIICFDANKSPTRLVQRMGRTGRQRQGKTIFLLTQGKEERSYSQSVQQHSSISKSIIDASKLQPYLYKYSPRMVPAGVEPQCYKMEIILSSEQKNNKEKFSHESREHDTPEVRMEELPEDVDFEPQVKQKLKRTETVKRGIKRQVRDQNTATGSNSCHSNQNGQNSERGRQCVLSTKNKNNELCILKTTEDKAEHEPEKLNTSDCIIIEDEPCMKNGTDVGVDNDYDLLCDIFDVKNNDENSVAECIFIPKAPKSIKWLPEYNKLNYEDIVVKSSEFQALKEKLNAVYMMGPSSDHCGCGLPIADYFGCNLDDEAWADPDPVNNSHLSNSFQSVNPDGNSFQPAHTTNSNDNSIKCGSSVTSFSSPTIQTENPDLNNCFVFEENDPIFDDDWSGGKPDLCVDVVTKDGNPTSKQDRPKQRNVIASDDVENVICIKDDDDASTTNDEAFETTIRSQNTTGRVRLVPENDYVHFVCEPPSQAKTRINDSKENSTMKQEASRTNIPGFTTPKKGFGRLSEDVRPIETSPTDSNSSKDMFSPSPQKKTISKRPMRNPNPTPGRKFQFKEKPSLKLNPTNCTIPAFCSALASPASGQNVVRGISGTTSTAVFFSPNKCNPLSTTNQMTSQNFIHAKARNNELELQLAHRINRNDNSPIKRGSCKTPTKRSENPDPFDDDWPGMVSDLCGPLVTENGNQTSRQDGCEEEKEVIAASDDDENVICIDDDDYDGSSTTSDEAFKTIIRSSQRTESTGRVRLIKEDDYVRFVSEPPAPSKTSVNDTKGNRTMKQETSGTNLPGFTTPKRGFGRLSEEFKAIENSPTDSNSSKDMFSPSPIRKPLSRRPMRNPNLTQGRKFQFKANPSLKRDPTNCTITAFESSTPNRSLPVSETRQMTTQNWVQSTKQSVPFFLFSGEEHSEAIIKSQTPIPIPVVNPFCKERKKINHSNMNPDETEVDGGTDHPHNSFRNPNSTPGRKFQFKANPSLKRDPTNYTILTAESSTPNRSLEVSKRSQMTSQNWVQSMRPSVPLSVSSDEFEEDLGTIIKSQTRRPIVNPSRKRRKKRKRPNANPFVRNEAEVSGTDDSTAEEDDDLSDTALDQLDASFVDEDFSETMNESQQVRYMRSVKDVLHFPRRHAEKPLPPAADGLSHSWDNVYEADSFCVPENEVEYADVGVYTQAMICAREDLELENEELGNEATRSSASEMPPPPRPKRLRSRRLNLVPRVNNTKPRRRRIITYSDEED